LGEILTKRAVFDSEKADIFISPLFALSTQAIFSITCCVLVSCKSDKIELKMTPEDANYCEGVKDALMAVSEALDDLRDQVDCLLADIVVKTDDFETLDKIERKLGINDN